MGPIQACAFPNSTKRSMRLYFRSYLMFFQHFHFQPFPVMKLIYYYLAFLANSLSSYVSILTHVNRSLGCNLTFFHEYDVYLSQRAVRRLLGDYVTRKEPITIVILHRVFSFFDFSNPLHICMRALFLVAFFSFLRI